MPPHDEEDFELVLGNRQLFFLAVVLFGVFFSIGYTVGYSRGSGTTASLEETTPIAEAASENALVLPASRARESQPAPSEAKASERDLPKTFSVGNGVPNNPGAAKPASQSQSGSPDPAAVARNTQRTPPPINKPASDSSARNRKASNPARTPLASPATPGAKTPARKAAPPTAAPVPAPASTVAVPAIVPGSVYLQVAASRESGPARQVLLDMKSKGHPVTLDNIDPKWFRILVGPFPTAAAAAQYQLKLQAENTDSFIRKL